jgi:hypothetical protein
MSHWRAERSEPSVATLHAPSYRSFTATVDESGQVYLTTATGQSRTVTSYDYRMTDAPPANGSNENE